MVAVVSMTADSCTYKIVLCCLQVLLKKRCDNCMIIVFSSEDKIHKRGRKWEKKQLSVNCALPGTITDHEGFFFLEVFIGFLLLFLVN